MREPPPWGGMGGAALVGESRALCGGARAPSSASEREAPKSKRRPESPSATFGGISDGIRAGRARCFPVAATTYAASSIPAASTSFGRSLNGVKLRESAFYVGLAEVCIPPL